MQTAGQNSWSFTQCQIDDILCVCRYSRSLGTSNDEQLLAATNTEQRDSYAVTGERRATQSARRGTSRGAMSFRRESPQRAVEAGFAGHKHMTMSRVPNGFQMGHKMDKMK